MQVWSLTTGASHLREQHPAGFYAHLLQCMDQLSPIAVEDIAKDLDRTLPERSLPLQALQRLLSAFALLDPVVGYCQGMNCIAGALLLFFPAEEQEEDVFWLLAAILTSRRAMYVPCMAGCTLATRVMDDLLSFYEGDVSSHLRKLDVSFGRVCSTWLLCLFVEAPLPVESCARVWDIFWLVGEPAVYATGLALVQLNRKQLLTASTLERAMDLVLNHLVDHVQIDELCSAVRTIIDTVKDFEPHIRVLESLHRPQVVDGHARPPAHLNYRLVTLHDMVPSEVQQLWNEFLRPDPWSILSQGGLQEPWHLLSALQNAAPHLRPTLGQRTSILLSGFPQRLSAAARPPSTLLQRAHHSQTALSFAQFVQLVHTFTRGSRDARLRLCFDFFDLDRNGSVDDAELRSGLTVVDHAYNARRDPVVVAAEVEGFYLMMREKMGLKPTAQESAADQHVQWDFEAFTTVIVLHPQVFTLFQLDDSAPDG